MTPAELLQSQVTQEEAAAALKSYVLSTPSPPDDVTLDTPGTPENALIYGLALAEEHRSQDRANYAAAAYRSTAPIEYLRIHSTEFFGLPVQAAGYATTTMGVTNTTGNLYGPFEPGELRVVNDATKAVYENTAVVSFQPAQLSPFLAWTGSFAVRAVEAGTVSNAAIGDIDRLETALDGITVTNTQPASTTDDESKESINRRIDARIGLLGVAGAEGLSSGGPATAAESIALSGRDSGGGCLRADGTRVQVTRTKLVRNDTTGISTIYVGDDDGPLDPADLTVVGDEVGFYAEWVTSRIATANVVAVVIAIDADLTIRNSKLSDSEIDDLIEASLPAASLTVPIGGFDVSPNNAVPIEYLEGTLREPLIGKATVVTIAVTLPAADVLFAVNEVAILQLGTLTITRIP